MKYLFCIRRGNLEAAEWNFIQNQTTQNRFCVVKKSLNSYKLVDGPMARWKLKFYNPEKFEILGYTDFNNLRDCLENEYPEYLL